MSNIHFELFKFMNEHGDKTQDVRKSVMPDRKKVISGLKHCSFGEKRGCAGCPYNDECGDWGRDAGVGSLCTDALALLREQEPVEPTKQHIENPKLDLWYCGKCGNWIAKSFDYCPWCGKAVKWDDD